MALSEVDHLRERERARERERGGETSRDLLRNNNHMMHTCTQPKRYIPLSYQNIVPELYMTTNLVSHLGNKGRLPGNDVGDPQGGSELVGHLSVNRRPGFRALHNMSTVTG